MRRGRDMGFISLMAILFTVQLPVEYSTCIFLAFVAYRRNNV